MFPLEIPPNNGWDIEPPQSRQTKKLETRELIEKKMGDTVGCSILLLYTPEE